MAAKVTQVLSRGAGVQLWLSNPHLFHQLGNEIWSQNRQDYLSEDTSENSEKEE